MSPKDNISFTLKAMKIPYEVEYKFLPNRKYRADWAIPSHNILIEYEGLISAKSRHTTIGGYSGDSTKYNLATINGWRVLRYTALTYKNLFDEITFLMKQA